MFSAGATVPSPVCLHGAVAFFGLRGSGLPPEGRLRPGAYSAFEAIQVEWGKLSQFETPTALYDSCP
jgi:hypothetical protein